MWSIVQRELREQARQVGTYWLRLSGAVLLLLVFGLVWNSNLARAINGGRGYFVGLNRLLFATIWLIGPVLTADCLSREKRDGTLGLLFLTPLRARDVVLGKGFVNALKAFAVLLAALPVLVVPILLGGVSWPDAVKMFLLHGAALGLALTAGMVASSCTASWIRARLLAVVLAVGAGVVFLLLHVGMTTLTVWFSGSGTKGMELSEMFGHNFQTLWFRNSIMLRTPAYFWRDFSVAAGGWSSVRFAAGVFGISLLLVVLAVGVATRAVRMTWQGEPPSPAWQRRIRFFTAVRVSKGWFRDRMRRLMDLNPIWWRHLSTWSARVVTLGWLGLAMVLLTAAFTGLGAGATRANWALEKLLLVGIAFSSAASFRQERESGALELLLVTGLEPARMLRGRLLALGVQFLPASVLVWGTPLLFALFGGEPFANVGWRGFLWLLPTAALGVTLSLSRVSFLASFLAAAAVHPAIEITRGFLARAFAGQVQGMQLPPSEELLAGLTIVELGAMVTLTRRAWVSAVRTLEHRTFVADGSIPATKPVPVPEDEIR